MRSRVADLAFVRHEKFGIGAVLAERQTDSGTVLDIWFLDGKTRALLSSHLEDVAAPELDRVQRKELRHAVSAYLKAHVKRARQTPNKPRLKRAFRDRLFKGELRHVSRGDDSAPADVDEDLPAESAA